MKYSKERFKKELKMCFPDVLSVTYLMFGIVMVCLVNRASMISIETLLLTVFMALWAFSEWDKKVVKE